MVKCGCRPKTKSDGDTTRLIEQVNSAGSIPARFTDTQNADEPLATTSSGTSNYYEQDGLGSVTSLTNSSGSVSQTYTFDSFGNLTNSSGSVSNPFQYTGREFDSETGLYYYRARYYDPGTGRFVSSDPLGFMGGVNQYAYVGGNAINKIDPFGLCSIDIYFTRLAGGAAAHSFLVFTDRESTTEVRAGPNRPVSNSEALQDLVSVYPEPDHYIHAEVDEYDPELRGGGWPDQLSESIASVNVLSNGCLCDQFIDAAQQIVDLINNKLINYSAAGPNSNSVTTTVLDVMGLPYGPPPPSVGVAPGYGTNLLGSN